MQKRNVLTPIKVMAPEFQSVHRFVNSIRGTFNQKLLNFYSLSHVCYDDEFIIFILYHPGLFDIDALISHVCNSAEQSDLYRYNWKTHRTLTSIRDNQKFYEEDYDQEAVISFSVI